MDNFIFDMKDLSLMIYFFFLFLNKRGLSNLKELGGLVQVIKSRTKSMFEDVCEPHNGCRDS